MMRLKLPNGIVTSEQLRILAQITEDAGEGGCGDITTRQNFQLRGITLDKAPAIFEQLESCGLTTIQSGMVSSSSPPPSPPSSLRAPLDWIKLDDSLASSLVVNIFPGQREECCWISFGWHRSGGDCGHHSRVQRSHRVHHRLWKDERKNRKLAQEGERTEKEQLDE